MIYYEKHICGKNKDWIIFIHGLGGSLKTWKYQMDEFLEYNTLFVDLQGHGNSEMAACRKIGKASSEDILDIMDKEHIKSVHIVSLSLGTAVALDFVKRHHEKVKSVVLAGMILNLNWWRKSLIGLAAFCNQVMPVKMSYSFFARIIMPKKTHEKSRKIFVREACKISQKAFGVWLNLMYQCQRKGREYIEILNENRIPTMIASGKEDYLFLPGVEKFASALKEKREILFEKCGHVCSIDKKEQFNREVSKFILSVTEPDKAV